MSETEGERIAIETAIWLEALLFGGSAEELDIVCLVLAQRGFLEQVGHPDNCVQWCTDFVGHGGQEDTLGLG